VVTGLLRSLMPKRAGYGNRSTMAEMISQHVLQTDYDDACEFTFGLGLIRDGLDRLRDTA
jgi:hypothetical protein